MLQTLFQRYRKRFINVKVTFTVWLPQTLITLTMMQRLCIIWTMLT